MAYVGNLVPFLISQLAADPGIRLYNYGDKPDLSTSDLVRIANASMGREGLATRFNIPYPIGLAGGFAFDVLAKTTGKKYPLSSIRIRKFCADTTVSADRVERSGFNRPYSLSEGIQRMIESEFLSKHQQAPLFDSAGG